MRREDTGDMTGKYPGTPRWVIVSGIIILVLVVLLVGLHLVSGGMGPMNHLSSVGGH